MGDTATVEDAFIAAIMSDDPDAMERHFARPDVLASVAFWNAQSRAERRGEPRPDEVPNRFRLPWYCGWYKILRDDRVDAYRWLLARDRIDLLGDSLCVLVGHITLFLMMQKSTPTAREMLQAALESVLFEEVLTDDERSKIFASSVHAATQHGANDWINFLLAFGADPNAAFTYQPPHRTNSIIALGTAPTLEFLVDQGASLQGRVVFFPRHEESEDIVRAMLAHGVDVNGDKVLQLALRHCSPGTVRVLIEEGYADVDKRGRRGRVPLLLLASDPLSRQESASKITMTELLLEGGADIHAIDDDQRGVLHYAVYEVNTAWWRWLLERGANPNHQNAKGRTPMMSLLKLIQWHVDPNASEILSLLLHAGADPYLPDNRGANTVTWLERSRSGRAFMLEKQGFFRRTPE